MTNATLASRYYKTRFSCFKWRESLSLTNKIALALGMAVITGLLAQIRIPVAWTPVPITGQTLAVLLAGVLLGRNWGGISMVLYAALGAAGVPWFAGWGGGLAVLTGPTGGYIVGFFLAALFLGYVTDKYINSRGFFAMFTLMTAATLFLIFIPGLIQLSIWFSIVKGSAPAFGELLVLGFYPFLIGALIKISLAALISKGITPKENYS